MSKFQIFWGVTVTVLFIFVVYIFVQQKPPKKPKYVTHAAICNADGICLVNLVTEKDKDGDGFSDADEVAADTDPRDPKSYPSVRQLIDLAGKGRLDSFNRGLNYIVVIPEKLPNGDVLIKSGFSEGRKDTMASLGISEDRLKSVGLSLATGVTVASLTSDLPDLRPPAGSGTKAPPVGLGKFGIGLISQKGDESMNAPQSCVGMGCASQAPPVPTPLTPEEAAASTTEAAVQAQVDAKNEEPGPNKDRLQQYADAMSSMAKELNDKLKKEKRTTGDDDNQAIPLTKAVFERAKIKLGQNRTPGPSVGPAPGDVDPADVIPSDDIIALFDGEQKDYPISDRLKYFVVAPKFRPNSDKNTNYGPNGPRVLDVIVPGSGLPPKDPGAGPGTGQVQCPAVGPCRGPAGVPPRQGVGRTPSGQPN